MNAEAAPSIESNREEKPAHRAPRCEAQCEFHPCGRTQLQAGRPLPDHAFPTGGGRCGWDAAVGWGSPRVEEGLGVPPPAPGPPAAALPAAGGWGGRPARP